MLEALIFDCDGVLADSERFGHLPAFNRAFVEFGFPLHWSEGEYCTASTAARLASSVPVPTMRVIHSSGVRRNARCSDSSRFANVVLPEPGRPQIRNRVAPALRARGQRLRGDRLDPVCRPGLRRGARLHGGRRAEQNVAYRPVAGAD